MRTTPGHGTKLSYYDFGKTVFYACQADERFSYCCYIPEEYDETSDKHYPLLAVVHGSERMPETYRQQFVAFAEQHNIVVLLPLFPVGAGDDGDGHAYKFVEYGSTRYDKILLAMIDEASKRWRLKSECFMLHGFSGGGHFTHRFLYLHPERLLAASVGAPGIITMPDETKASWSGVADLETRFGKVFNAEALKNVKLQFVTGNLDTETWEIAVKPDYHAYNKGINDETTNRLQKLTALRDALTERGVSVQLDIVPGVAHDGFAVLPYVKAFFAEVIRD